MNETSRHLQRPLCVCVADDPVCLPSQTSTTASNSQKANEPGIEAPLRRLLQRPPPL